MCVTNVSTYLLIQIIETLAAMSQQPDDWSVDNYLHHARYILLFLDVFGPPGHHLIQQATNDITHAHGQEFPLPISPITAVLGQDVPAVVPAAARPAAEPNRCHPPPGRCAGNFELTSNIPPPLSGPHECTWSGRKLTITCTTCGKVFPRKSDFNRHYNNIHDKTLHHCPFPGCNSVFARRDNVIPHRRSVHGEIIEVIKAAPPGSRARARARAVGDNRDGAQGGNMDVEFGE
ncbi:hypothetical protein DFP73DRAFT_529086 [Morchella snyderi]|nr:hypothetical protein DFP73DRAFT_529086 [Morchella snyderi]